ncbi:unnamed protein product, partial [Gordionus sp. m RMFG-2023]
MFSYLVIADALKGNLNDSRSNCTVYKNIDPKLEHMKLIFEYLSIILWILGLFGNAIGLYVAMRDKIIYVRVYISRVFFTSNLINIICMLIFPIIEISPGYILFPFKGRLPWNVFLVYFHFPIAETLVSYSFSVYVIYAFCQMIAIMYPLHYKYHFTLKKIQWMLALTFFYSLAWYIPSAWWFEIVKRVNICGLDPNLVIYAQIFGSNKLKANRRVWIIFGMFREILTRFIPVTIIIISNYLTLKHKKSSLNWRKSNYRAQLPEIPSPLNLNLTVVLSDSKESCQTPLDTIRTGHAKSKIFPVLESSSNGYLGGINTLTELYPETLNSKILTATSKTITIVDSLTQIKIKQSILEYKRSKRMMAILILEFVVFLFPVSIYITTVDFYEHLLTTEELDIVFIVFTILEYAYISLNFYLNMIFNPTYRKDVFKLFRHSKLRKFCGRHKNL